MERRRKSTDTQNAALHSEVMATIEDHGDDIKCHGLGPINCLKIIKDVKTASA
jgi:hypothetical protein